MDKSDRKSTMTDLEDLSLIDRHEKEHYQPQSLKSRLKLSVNSFLRRPSPFNFRIVKPDNPSFPRSLFPPTNIMNNNKYTLFNCLFLFLYYEFSMFSNFYYLLLCVTQFFNVLKVGWLKRLSDQLSSPFGHDPCLQSS